jgi:hypothetical protein
MRVEISPEQAEHLEALLAVAKAMASPGRLVLLGVLAAQPARTWTLEELAKRTRLAPNPMGREVRQLIEVGLARVVEWSAARPGAEPEPYRVAFNLDYPRQMPQRIAALHQITQQVRPATPARLRDERSRTLERFMQGGRLVAWPDQIKRQRYLLEVVVNAFTSGTRYSEREVDTILKDIYAYDHCVVRRALVDHNFLQRDHGVYWRPDPAGAVPPLLQSGTERSTDYETD